MTPYDYNLELEADKTDEVEALYERYAKDPEKIAEADTWLDGALDEAFYNGIETMFANIGDNGLMPEYVDTILSLAKIASKAREERIYWLSGRDAC